MTPEELENLLQQEENEYLEFKEKIDFDAKESKGHFLKEILSLVNTTHSPAFLVIGVEDKTKRLVGVKDITEEQLQQIVTEYCKPPIPFSYRVISYKDVSLGVIQIFRSNLKPHTLKTRFTYQDTNGKPQEIRETQVFTRHGSIVGEASREELLALSQDRDSNAELLSRIVGELEKIGTEFPEVSYNLREIYNQLYDNRPRIYNDRVIEGVFISIVTGSVFALVLSIGIYPPFVLVLWFAIGVVFSALRVVNYDFFRTLINSILLGTLLGVLFSIETSLSIIGGLTSESPIIAKLATGAIIGAVSGTIGSFIILRLERLLRHG